MGPALLRASVLVLESAELADGDAFAGFFKFLVTDRLALARLQALGGSLVCGGNGTVARDIFLGFLVAMCVRRYRKSSCQRKPHKRKPDFFHKSTSITMDKHFNRLKASIAPLIGHHSPAKTFVILTTA
jgi:hypothetical protein